MLTQFTPRVQHAFALARSAASQYKSASIRLEEMAIGMLDVDQGSHFEIWKALGFDAKQFEAKVRAMMESRSRFEKMPSQIPYAGEVKRLLAMASREAKRMKNTHVGTAHLLLGLLCVDSLLKRLLRMDSPVGRLLREMGLTRERVVEQALKVKKKLD